MKYQISHYSSARLRELYINSRPRIGYAEATGNIIANFILTKLIWTRNFFERLQKSGGFTREIKSRAARNLGRNQRNINKEISRLMVQRIGAIGHEVRVQKRKCISISNTVENAFDPHSRRIYLDIKSRETSRV